MTIKEAIVKELNDRGWSHYRLVQEVKGKLPARTVYSFLSGERDLTSERTSILLQALGLQITKPKSSQGLRRQEKWHGRRSGCIITPNGSYRG